MQTLFIINYWSIKIDNVVRGLVHRCTIVVCFQKASVEGLQGIHLNIHQLFPQLFSQLFKSFNNCLLHCFICSGIVSKVWTIYKIVVLQKHRQLFLISNTCLNDCNNFRQKKQTWKQTDSTCATIWTRSCFALLWPQQATQTWVSLSTKRGQYVCIQWLGVLIHWLLRAD